MNLLKQKNLKTLTVAVASAVLSAHAVADVVYKPEILSFLSSKTYRAEHPDLAPNALKDLSQEVYVIDLDDTLFNARSRTLTIIKDFARQPEIEQAYPNESRKAQRIKLAEVKYALADTLSAVAITNAEFNEKLSAFWKLNFFGNKYCENDLPIPGAAKFVRKIHDEGAVIVYLTGRDQPNMGECTVAALKKRGFPQVNLQEVDLHGLSRVSLMMKPLATMDDLTFKQQAIGDIARNFVWTESANTARKSDVMAILENEPANLNALASSFPAAIPVFLDTAHSSRPDVPTETAIWVKNFKAAPATVVPLDLTNIEPYANALSAIASEGASLAYFALEIFQRDFRECADSKIVSSNEAMSLMLEVFEGEVESNGIGLSGLSNVEYSRIKSAALGDIKALHGSQSFEQCRRSFSGGMSWTNELYLTSDSLQIIVTTAYED